ncbi:hypothetical protein [Pedomonas mirosovicensis]|uniref:hypothetical protein n=1 Tax=Pedomonas mirosovicensis TaxID=2908641 RepID=UPI00216A42A3|nr:hypothetical protein [Pedomonas mirosovicensis]MCH8684823.1 hypothetical protein [Pedomonas mirosovicensis]
MTALQARVVGANGVENQSVQAHVALSGKDAGVQQAGRRNRRRPGVYKPAGQQFPLFHAWRP